jgi:hypothetical protein
MRFWMTRFLDEVLEEVLDDHFGELGRVVPSCRVRPLDIGRGWRYHKPFGMVTICGRWRSGSAPSRDLRGHA